MATLKSFLEAILSPVGIMTICFVSGMAMHLLHRQSRAGPRFVWIGVGLFLVTLLTPLAEVFYANLEHAHPPMLHADISVRYVAVLGGYGEDLAFLPITSKLGEETVLRMGEGIRLYRELPNAKLIVSGGSVRSQDGPIANLMSEYAIIMGVSQKDILVEGRSSTTYENLLEVKKIVGAEPFILVTSSAELRRGVAVARQLGMQPLAAPSAIWAARYYPASLSWREWGWKLIRDTGSPSAERFVYIQRAHHEYLGYAWYWLLGRL